LGEVVRSANCDPVVAQIQFTNSTIESEVYLDRSSIGQIDKNGMFSRQTLGLCRDSMRVFVAAKPSFEPWKKWFKLKDNPHLVVDSFQLKYRKK
jgi:hypothetical protein